MESPVCPKCNLLKNDKNTFIRYIKDNYGDNEIVFTDELRERFRYLKAEYLFGMGYVRLMPGIFAKKEFNDEEIIRKRYLYRKNYIGYSYSESFAYELGLTNKPEIYGCCTLMDKSPKGRLIQVRDTKVRVRGVIEGFDSNYWREWQLLDFLYCVNKYRGHKTIDEVIDLIMKHINNHNLDKEYLIEHMISKKSIYIDSIMEKLHEKKK